MGLVLFCNRNNPFDVQSDCFNPGSRPHAQFWQRSVSALSQDTVRLKILCSDTAKGGVKGAIRKFYFNWSGGASFTDSVGGTDADSFIVKRVFAGESTTVRMAAVDYDGRFSDIDSILVRISFGPPVITDIEAPDSVLKNSPFIMSVSAHDGGGGIASYVWARNGVDFLDTSFDSSFTLSLDTTGNVTVLVKVFNTKNIASDVSSVGIFAYEKVDTSGPAVLFLSPQNNDTSGTRTCVVYLQVKDESKVKTVSVNGIVMQQQTGETWRGAIQLSEGRNVIAIEAADQWGNIGRNSITIFYISGTSDVIPPVLVLKQPPRNPDTVNRTQLLIRLLASDASGVANVSLNDSLMAFDPLDSSYYRTVSLNEGANRFFIRAVDAKGNMGYDTVEVYYDKDYSDTVSPRITISEPRNLAHIADTGVLVKGTVTDVSGISSILVNGAIPAFSYPNWSRAIKLQYGYNTIKVAAVDSSVNRNTSADSIRVIQNAPPAFTTTPPDTHVMAGSPYSATIQVNHPDNDSLVFTPVYAAFHSSGLPVVTQTAKRSVTVSYTPVAAGVDTLMLLVRDEWNDADTLQWRVIIQALVDSSPVFITDIRTLRDTLVALDTYAVKVKAIDPFNRPITYSLISPPSPAAMKIDNAGNIIWTPAEGDTGTMQIRAAASNGKQADSLSWNILILPFDWPPVLQNPGDKTVNEGQALRITLAATDKNNDQLEFMFGSQFPSGARLDSNRFSWTPWYNEAGRHTVVFVVRELNRTPALTDTQTITVTVNNVNQPPVIAVIGNKTGVAGQTLSFTLSASDPDSNTLTFRMLNAPSGASLTGNRFSWTPTSAQIGSFSVTFYVVDNGTPALSDSQTISITIIRANNPPTLRSPGNKTVDENQLLQFTLSATDPDNDNIVYTMLNRPSGATLSGKTFSWTPSYSQAGTYQVTFVASDNVSPPLSDSATITITVNNVNAPPVLQSPGNKTATPGQELQFTLIATDPDTNQTLRYSMTGAPTDATLNGNRFSWTPSRFSFTNYYTVTFTVRDNGSPALSSSVTITIRVQ
jgi:hypothetical protein